MVVVVWGLLAGSRPVSSGDKKPIRVVIVQGASARMVAGTLSENKLIRSSFIFLITCKVSGASEKIKPGVYEMNRSMSAPEIIKRLVEGDTLETWVTIPEGKTLREIADTLGEKQLTDPAAFLQLTTGHGCDFSNYSFIYADNLEGYLFPDTYLVARGVDTEDIVKKMLDAFDEKVVAPNRLKIEQVNMNKFHLGEADFAEGLHRILTIASLVEREAKTREDRPKVAQVIWNRLAKNMRLEVDATVSYSLGTSRANKARVLFSDLKKDSPYNTYLHAGLPPAPICNPGLASIKAVLNPAPGDYLYYVAKKDGSHVFSRTLQEHNAAKNAIRNGKL